MNRTMKEKIKVCLHDVNIFRKYGFTSFCKEIENRQFHETPDIETIRKTHIIPEDELDAQRNHVFQRGIKFSIITPLYNTPNKYLVEMLESLRNQTYANWELCLADGSDGEHSYVGEVCRQYQKEDSRIKYKILKENKGISENTNECMKLASGQYYGLLDHDDVLHPSALFEVMSTIEEQQADFIYTDEVKFSGSINDINSPSAFNFKPGFGKYDLQSHNFICHFTVFSRELLKGEKQFYRSEYDGSQDHDMVLRLTEKAENIVHIPKVLYYWRLHSNSVSQDLNSKNYAVDAAIRAVTSQLERTGEKGIVKSNLPFLTIYRIEYEIKGQPLVSIVLHGSKRASDIEKSIVKILENTDYRPIEFIYESKGDIKLKEPEGIKITHIEHIYDLPKGKLWNQMIETSQGDYIILFDTKSVPLNREWLQEMLMLCQREDVGVVGPKISYRDGRIAYAGGALWRNEKNKVKIIGRHDKNSDMGYEALLCHVRNTTWTVAACMMFSKLIWEDVGGFPEYPSGYEEIEFCLRSLEQRKNNVWTCFSKIQYIGKTIFEKRSEEQKRLFEDRYRDCFEKEKFFHPNWENLRLV